MIRKCPDRLLVRGIEVFRRGVAAFAQAFLQGRPRPNADCTEAVRTVEESEWQASLNSSVRRISPNHFGATLSVCKRVKDAYYIDGEQRHACL